jgi:hypothetical protein
MKKYKITYWIATSIIIFMIGLGSFADIFMIDAMKESINMHRFPVYFLPFFGLVKLAAVVVLLVPTFKRFKEVAYGGLFFYFLGAIYSHLALGDGLFGRTLSAWIAFTVVMISYVVWRKLEQKSIPQTR